MRINRQYMWGFCTQVARINPNLLNMNFQIRGDIEINAMKIKHELAQMHQNGVQNNKYPFNSLVECHIGNPQMMGQSPITFIREVMACCVSPSFQEFKNINPDVRNRARFYTSQIGPSIGAYTSCNGYQFAREAVSSFIGKRDNAKPPNPNNIILCDGATQGIMLVMKALLGRGDGVLNPHPSYPLYLGLIGLQETVEIPYYLNEETQWSLDIFKLKKIYNDSVQKGIKPRMLVVINPNNPTGMVMDRDQVQEIVRFAYERKITILADEVYQENIHQDNKKFHSFHSVMQDMPHPYKQANVYSFHSGSKGFLGECGFRGGYVHASCGVDPLILTQINKLKSVELCANSVGQILMALKCTPPVPGESSQQTIDTYYTEFNNISQSLKNKARIAVEELNQIDGISCQPIQGSMFAFPSIDLPEKFKQQALIKGIQPDAAYCMQAVQDLGLVMVPGSGFGQAEGSYHFRMTILPQEEQFLQVFDRFKLWNHKLRRDFRQ